MEVKYIKIGPAIPLKFTKTAGMVDEPTRERASCPTDVDLYAYLVLYQNEEACDTHCSIIFFSIWYSTRVE